MKGSCFRLVGRYGTCLQCLSKLVLTDMRGCLCFASFLYLKFKCGSEVTGLYRLSNMLAYIALGPSDLWICFAARDLGPMLKDCWFDIKHT